MAYLSVDLIRKSKDHVSGKSRFKVGTQVNIKLYQRWNHFGHNAYQQVVVIVIVFYFRLNGIAITVRQKCDTTSIVFAIYDILIFRNINVIIACTLMTHNTINDCMYNQGLDYSKKFGNEIFRQDKC